MSGIPLHVYLPAIYAYTDTQTNAHSETPIRHRGRARLRRQGRACPAPAKPLRIVDQNGRLAVNGVPSATSTIVDVTVGQGFTFMPSTVNMSVGDTVRWTWASSGHSVSSGTPCIPNGQFCSPDNTNCQAGTLSNLGTVYEHTFTQLGTYSYFCHAHCEYGMTGVVNVAPRGGSTPRPRPTPGPRPTL